MRRHLSLTVVLLALALGAAACGSESDGATGGGETTVTTAVAQTTADPAAPTSEPGASVPDFEGGTDPVEGEAQGDATALLTDVRVARNEGFDRVVFEFAGDDLPGYDVRYVEGPFATAGEGADVTVEGDFFLQVNMQGGSGFNLDTGEQTYFGEDRIVPDGTVRITDLVQIGDFEALLEWVVGTNRQVPFKVTTLSSPSRIVVDLDQAE